MTAPGTPKASQAAITAVQEALGCAPVQSLNPSPICKRHRSKWVDRGCAHAIGAADAAAPHNAADALKSAARDLRFCADDANLLDSLAYAIEASQ